MTTTNDIQEIVNGMVYDSNKDKFVKDLYWKLRANGVNAYLLNWRYIELHEDGTHRDFQLINHRSERRYEVKQF